VAGPDGTELIKVGRHTEAGDDHARLVLDVSGDIDADTAPVLHAALSAAIDRHRHVCCDLTGVDFLGAAGANTIIAALRHADETDCAFTVRGVHGLAARVFRITGLDALIPS
jgi:anti-anti-sigma factor